MDDLDAPIRAEVDEAIRSEAGESAASIFRRFGLNQRGLKLDTFTRYTRKVRETEWTDRPTPTEVPSMQALMDQLLIGAYEAAVAGGMKPYEMASLIARVQEHDRLAIQRDADKRAAELHEARLKKLEPAIKDAIAEPTTQGSKDLREILEGVSGGTLSIDVATRRIGDVLWIEIDKQMRGVA